MNPFWVYIVRCADNSYYTGHTDQLDHRIGQHEKGEVPSCYTFKRRPIKLVFSQPFATREEALSAEQKIKGWSRKKKEAMMRGDWAEVSKLARSTANSTALRQAQGERRGAKGPVLITEHSQASLHLVDVEDNESMQHGMALFEGIARGEKALQEGRTLSNKEAKAKMAKWLE